MSGCIITNEGRVTIPVDVRRAMGVAPGDRVSFEPLGDGSFRVVSARSLIEAVWAKNLGGDARDAERDVRDERSADAARTTAWESEVDATDLDAEAAFEALSAQLGLRR